MVSLMLPGPVQVLRDSELIAARWVPDRPLPDLKVPDQFEVLQGSVLPVVWSVSTILVTEAAVTGPPGVTVHVVAVTAAARPGIRATLPVARNSAVMRWRM